jgi:hypothetical protein
MINDKITFLAWPTELRTSACQGLFYYDKAGFHHYCRDFGRAYKISEYEVPTFSRRWIFCRYQTYSFYVFGQRIFALHILLLHYCS